MPPIHLNHLLIFVDNPTYRAIADSDFLNKELAPAEQRTTIDEENDASWTGCYYYGNRTYFEFMDPEATTWKPLDGIAFGVDEPESASDVRNRLVQALHTDVRHYPRTRRYEDRDVPWFDMIEYDRLNKAQMVSWVMAYDPEFLQQWEPHLPPASCGVRREDVLQRYRARVEDASTGDGYFKDVTHVTIALPEDDAGRFRGELAAYDYDIRDEHERYTAEGPDITIQVEQGNPPHTGIRAFTMSLHHQKTGNRAYTFSPQCKLTFGEGLTATWTLY